MAHAKAPANPNEFILPDLGEGVHEAELIAWKVEVGQRVAEHDILAEMETDKALVEVPSPRAGTIAVLHGSPGEILKVGNPLVTYAPEGSAQAEAKPSKPSKAAPRPSATTEPAPAPVPAPAPDVPGEDAGTVVGSMSGGLAGVGAPPGKALATPAVRRLARDLGVDINAVEGTGIGGRVTERDVRAAAGGGAGLQTGQGRTPPPGRAPDRGEDGVAPARRAPAAPAPAPRAAPGDEVTRTPVRGVRRTIATRLRQSVDRAVHFNVVDEADVTALDALRRRLAAASGEKVSLLPLVASAVCRVLGDARFRVMNSTVDEPEGADAEVVTHRAVHMGIATDTGSGLMVPVVRDCDRMGVLEIARAVGAAAAAARDRTIAREALTGSTFTISNVGSHAGRFATPIINYPEVAILGLGRARQAPVIRQTPSGPCLGVGLILPLSLACDHRVVDGATAAMALAELIRLLQEDGEGLMGPARG